VPELRKDPVVERWVIIATERARRPMDFAPEALRPRGPEGCPFCPGHEDMTPPELFRTAGDGDGGWSVRVVPNKFPALRVDGELSASGEGIYDRMDGVGAHEVVVETPEHAAGLGSLPETHVGQVLLAYRERLQALKQDPRFEYVLVFKNHGLAAGASLEHPHSQVVATPILPELVVEERAGAARYFRMKERCVWCDIVRQERRDGTRLVLEDDGFVAVAPFAPRFPYETWVLPVSHQANFEALADPEIPGLARLLRELVARLGQLFNDPPYNFALHTAPLRDVAPEHFHWHLELMPKLTRLAGFELGSGFFMNPTPPEDAARFLRAAGSPGAAVGPVTSARIGSARHTARSGPSRAVDE
jgi:UDPglucose--hexose-1-phosphate uridylyltransferase